MFQKRVAGGHRFVLPLATPVPHTMPRNETIVAATSLALYLGAVGLWVAGRVGERPELCRVGAWTFIAAVCDWCSPLPLILIVLCWQRVVRSRNREDPR
jgi:hypothetical protein